MRPQLFQMIDLARRIMCKGTGISELTGAEEVGFGFIRDVIVEAHGYMGGYAVIFKYTQLVQGISKMIWLLFLTVL
jgi:hypothetical protein